MLLFWLSVYYFSTAAACLRLLCSVQFDNEKRQFGVSEGEVIPMKEVEGRREETIARLNGLISA